MLNLSDKELDRLSREAAQEYDPGELTGSRGWERLEVHLDRDLGKVGPNPMRGFRRFPFFYAPAILLLLGVSYYFVRQTRTRKADPSGSPPMTVLQTPAEPGRANDPTKDLSSTKNAEHSDNSTSTPDKKPVTVQYPAGSGQPAAVPATGRGTPTRPDEPTTETTAGKSAAGPAGMNPSAAAGKNLAAPNGKSSTPAADKSSAAATLHENSASIDKSSSATASGSRSTIINHHIAKDKNDSKDNNNSRGTGDRNSHTDLTLTGSAHRRPSSQGRTSKNGFTLPRDKADKTGQVAVLGETTAAAVAAARGGRTEGTVANASMTRPRELAYSPVRQVRSMKQTPAVPDFGLRTFTAKAAPIQPPKKKGVLRINRSLQLGLSIAPDFSSVNSLAGDRPGSSIGLTVDYQFANHWYLSTGLLVSRKNYAARTEDYHVPYDYFRDNNLHNVDFVKGTFNMLEIPLNLRYDFSVAGNTVFFASGGLSSYLFTNENCNYYYNNFGRETSRGFKYSNQENYLFSSFNLSLGVEAGISNSLSVLVAPYMKIPTRNVGFGQVQMNSVGINFALKYAPVLSRKRR